MTPLILRVQTDLKTWRQTPLELALTLGLGPTIPFSFNPDERKQLILPHGRLQLIGVFPHEINSWGSGTVTNRTQVDLGRGTGDKPVVTAAFLCYEQVSNIPIEIEFFDKEHWNLPSHGLSFSDEILLASYVGTISDLAGVQVNYFADVHRIVLSLPALPNLPEENANLENLFDTVIPFIGPERRHIAIDY